MTKSIWKIGLAPTLRCFFLTRWSRVLLKRPVTITEMLMNPWKDNGNHILCSFSPPDTIKPEIGGPWRANSGLNHHRLRILKVLYNSKSIWSIKRPNSVVLMIVCLLDGKKLAISEQNPIPWVTRGAMKKLSSALKSHVLSYVWKNSRFEACKAWY